MTRMINKSININRTIKINKIRKIYWQELKMDKKDS